MTAFLVEYGGPIVGILIALAGLLGIYKKGKNDEGEKRNAEETARQAKAQAIEAARTVAEIKHEAKVTEGVANVQADVIRMPVGAAADRLRDQWSRD